MSEVSAASGLTTWSFWKGLLFGKKTNAGAINCGGEEPKGRTEEILSDGGIPLVPNEEGRVVVVNDAGDTVVLTVNDAGEIKMPEDLWQEVVCQTSGDVTECQTPQGFFTEGPTITVETGQISGWNLQKLNLKVVLGTDSTSIEGMPESACFDGMINTNAPDIEAEDVPCPETGYENFLACPSNEGNRLKLYLASYAFQAYDTQGNIIEDEFSAPHVLTHPEELYADPESGQILGVVCEGSDQPQPYEIEIPEEYYSDGNLNFKLSFQLVVDDRQADRNAVYTTWMSIKVRETP